LFSGKEIKLDKDITVNGNTVIKDDYKPNAAIDANGNVSTNISLSLPDLDPDSFPSNNSNSDLEIKNTSTINHTSEVFYDKIEIKEKDITVNFTGGGPFHIDELEVKDKNVTLNFAAGIYYIKKFKIDDKEATLNVTSSPVIFHIGDEFKIDGKDTNINTSGNVDDFLVYLHSGTKFESKEKNLDFTGLIYGPNVDKVEVEGKDSTIHGAIIVAGGEIELKKENLSFTYTSADQTAIGNISSCGGGGGDTPATAFNCVENGADGISGNLYTKTTTQSFSFDIVALQDASTLETNFASGVDHTVSVELVDASSGTCSSYSTLSPLVSQNLLFTASDSGTKTSVVMNSSTAYKNVKCRVTDNTNSPAVVGCSTDSFAIRPTNFSITSNLTNSGFTGPPKAKTGENFTLSATAISGYSGTPEINNGKLEAHSGSLLTGSIAGSFGSADSNTGTATGTAFTYNEVGSLRFAAQGIYDDTFTAVDQGSDCTNDFSNTLVGEKVGCKFGNTSYSNYFGRFTPDHIDVTLNTPVFSTGCGSFTYVGQPVKYTTQPVASIAAKNSSGSTTQNYTGDFWQIDPTDNTYAPTYTEASHTLSSINDNPSVTDNGDGTGTLSFSDTTSNILSINRNIPEAEFDAEIAMNFSLSDTDGIAVANVNGNPQSNPISFGATSTGNGISFSSNKTQRWGRVVLNNAHGSELSVLPMPLQTEYFNGTNFILNSSDNCTSISLNNQILLSNPNTSSGTSQPGNTAMTIGSGTSSAALDNNPLSAGSTNINFSTPGSGNTGYIDINSDFSILPWLLFDWDNDSNYDNSPSGKASFGIFKGNSKQIYFREVY
jgi:hypothetical protein